MKQTTGPSSLLACSPVFRWQVNVFSLKFRSEWLRCDRVALIRLCHLVEENVQVFHGTSKMVWLLICVVAWLLLTCSISAALMHFTNSFIFPPPPLPIPQRPAVPGTFGPLRGSDPTKLYSSPRVPEPHPGEPVQQHQHFAMQVSSSCPGLQCPRPCSCNGSC